MVNANTAVLRQDGGRLGAMARSATSIWVYWDGVPAEGPLALLVTDLGGRRPPDSLDRSGARLMALRPGQTHAYVENLPPGCLYCVEIGLEALDTFLPKLGPVSVQTPWFPGEWSGRRMVPPPSHRS